MISAPGKILLLGDYAVLEGGTAMVAAVNRRAQAELTERVTTLSSVVSAVLSRARKAGFSPTGGIEIDTEAFKDEAGNKLGLGSSAACAVVVAAAATGTGDERTLRIALEGHREASGGSGSGVDVAASFHGGVIATREQPAEVIPLPSRLGRLNLAVLFTGKSASTRELVEACRRGPGWAQSVEGMRNLAQEGFEAWQARDEARFLHIVRRYGRAMKQLGEQAGVEVVTEVMEAVMRLAEERGAGAKPSGAGGGDVMVMFARDPEVPAEIAEATGIELLDLEVDPRGLTR